MLPCGTSDVEEKRLDRSPLRANVMHNSKSARAARLRAREKKKSLTNVLTKEEIKKEDDLDAGQKEQTRKWFCKKCNQFFETRKLLRTHRKVIHLEPHREQLYNYTYNTETNTYSCQVCKTEFAKRTKMREHFLVHEEKFTCEVCSEVQYSAYRYSLHLSEHSGDGKYICPICRYVTSRKHSIAKHINTIHLRKYLYYCKHCGKGFHDVVTYTEHEKLHVGTNSVTCVVCQKQFSYTRNLTLHQTRYHRVTTIDMRLENQCHICKKSYSKSSTLKNHMRSHEVNTSKARPHLCEWCGKHFNDKGTLNHHNRIHTGYKPYKCSYCEKAFSRKGYLVLHERTHSGEKPYCCDHCGKRFNQPTSLRVHVRSHTGERPYSCHLCNHGFTSKSTLKNHVISCSG
ncbi:hypothetical protein Trydic_g205 [Trypoxylus dichotomus]